jgi:hypothetical protein
MFCIVTVVRVHVLCCDSGTREKKFEKHWSMLPKSTVHCDEKVPARDPCNYNDQSFGNRQRVDISRI